MRLGIQSRAGNVVLLVLGAIYLVAACTTLAYYIISNWGANSLTDYVLQAALLAAAVGGAFFIAVAAVNLKLWSRGAAATSRSSRDHRTAAAAGS